MATPRWGGNVDSPFGSGGVAGLATTSTAVAKTAADCGTLAVGAATAQRGRPSSSSRTLHPRRTSSPPSRLGNSSPRPPPSRANPFRPAARGATASCRPLPSLLAQRGPSTSSWPGISPTAARWEESPTPGRRRTGITAAPCPRTAALDVLSKSRARVDVLRGATRSHVEALFGSTIPPVLSCQTPLPAGWL